MVVGLGLLITRSAAIVFGKRFRRDVTLYVVHLEPLEKMLKVPSVVPASLAAFRFWDEIDCSSLSIGMHLFEVVGWLEILFERRC